MALDQDSHNSSFSQGTPPLQEEAQDKNQGLLHLNRGLSHAKKGDYHVAMKELLLATGSLIIQVLANLFISRKLSSVIPSVDFFG